MQLIEKTGKTLEYKKETDNSWIEYTGPITISTNCKLQYRIKGESEYKTEEITNIDKIAPIEADMSFNVTETLFQIMFHESSSNFDAPATSEYGCSGLKEMSIKILDYDWQKIDVVAAGYIFDVWERSNGERGSECNYQIKYVDNAGNEVIYTGSKIVRSDGAAM